MSSTAGPPTPSPSRSASEATALALLGIALCVEAAWTSRTMLSPDGVSYLDLAGLVRIGDLAGFVQGYWSPLYPALIGVLTLFTGDSPSGMIAVAHSINLAAAIFATVMLAWWARGMENPVAPRFLLAALLLASNGLPRVEAVTPDVLLLALMAWIASEWIRHRDRRPGRTGVALGLAFLAKTSIWPWLLVALPLRLWAAEDASGRRRVALSFGISLALASVWLIPLSVKARHPTLGSTGRLNYEWYIDSSDARTPDTHLGQHHAYRTLDLDATHQVTAAYFPDEGRWTYAPWSDPTAWAAGVVSTTAHPLTHRQLLTYWSHQAGQTFGDWLLGLLIGVVLPCWLVGWRSAPLRLLRADRHSLIAVLLGMAGVLQFVVVHSEPRLIAPFALLLALGALHPVLRRDAAGPTERPYRWMAASAVGWLTVIAFAIVGYESNIVTSREASRRRPTIPAGISMARVAVVGPALPVVARAFVVRARIIAQLPPGSLGGTRDLDLATRASLLGALFADRATAIWITDWDGTVKIIPVPPAPHP